MINNEWGGGGGSKGYCLETAVKNGTVPQNSAKTVEPNGYVSQWRGRASSAVRNRRPVAAAAAEVKRCRWGVSLMRLQWSDRTKNGAFG
jgi:hypothetical protein